MVNAIFYLNKTGCQWRYLPKDFPSYQLVRYYYHQWVDNNSWEKINTVIHRRLRQEVGRNEDPSAGIMDTQTVKGTPESAKESGFDGGKLIKGRKRHIIVDTMGYPIVSRVHAANVYEGNGAREVLNALFSIVDTVKKIWADGTDRGEWIDGAKRPFNCIIEIVKRPETEEPGFPVLPRRWVVERTCAWINRFRRLSKDDERKPESSNSPIYVASIRLMLRGIFKERTANNAEDAALLEGAATA